MKRLTTADAEAFSNQPADRARVANRWVVVGLLLAAATVCGFVLDHQVSLTSQAMIYVLAVVLASYMLDWLASAVCAVTAVTALNFFFVPPRWTLAVESREHLIALAAMLLVALVISRLAAGLRRESELARLNENRARQLQRLATELFDASTADAVLALGQAALTQAFAGPSVLALAREGELIPLNSADLALVGDGMRCAMREAAVLGPGTGRWPGLDAWYLPLGTKDHSSGAACVRPALATDNEGREHARALCTLLAQALWRLRLDQSVLTAQSEMQRQQVQSTFLAAVSHDLRTPLAAIVGAATSLQSQRERLQPTEQERLLSSIVSEASYLSSVTENTLQLVKLTSSVQALRRDWESIEEIIGAVLARLRQRDSGRRIRSSVPEGLPLVKADPVLLAQLLGNLLENALQYSSDTVDLSVCVEAQEMQVSVKDRGPGIPEAERERIFQPFVRNDHTCGRGVGLGLAVSRAIASAHGGSLSVRRRSGGGSHFMLRLPIEAEQPQLELS